MIDIVDRLRFDAVRCETQFSKGIAGNITEAADTIAGLRSDLALQADKIRELSDEVRDLRENCKTDRGKRHALPDMA